MNPSIFLHSIFSGTTGTEATFRVDMTTPVLSNPGKIYKSSELDKIATALGVEVARLLGPDSGRRYVAVIKENHFDIVVIACAIAKAGHIPVVLSDQISPPELEQVLLKFTPALIIIGDDYQSQHADELGTHISAWPRIEVSDLAGRQGQPMPDSINAERYLKPDTAEHGVMLVTHSSGTTGLPKLITHSPRSMREATKVELSRIPYFQIRRRDTVLANISFVHSRAFCWTFAQMKWKPRTSCAVGTYDYGELYANLADIRPTIFESLPNILGKNLPLLEENQDFFERVRIFINTYDIMHPAIAREYIGASKIRYAFWIHSWGQSEVGPIAAGFYSRLRLVSRWCPRDMNNMGWPWAGVLKIRVVSPAYPEKRVPRGLTGVVVVKSGSIATGYLGDESRYDAKWHGGWWNTGDIAVRNRVGQVIFVDRFADAICGTSITKLESEALELMPGVVDIVFLPAEDRRFTPVIVIPDEVDPNPYREQWDKVSAQFPSCRQAELVYWSDLPLTSTWKVRRHLLMKKLGLETDWLETKYA